jgi:hypothetical protein
VVSLVAELCGLGRQAVRGIGPVEDGGRGVTLDVSPAAIKLALLLTDEELDSLEKRAGVGEIARGGRPGGQMSQALNRLRAMVSPPKYSPPMPRPPTGDRGWMA